MVAQPVWTEDGCTRAIEVEIAHTESQGARVATIWECGGSGKLIAFVFDTDGRTTRLTVRAPEMYDLLQRVSDHFAFTNSPLGVAARSLLAKIDSEKGG